MKFLLVDDNELNLELQKLVLEGMGLSVVTADCGSEAIRLATTGEYAMIFMDIQMPEMDGFAAAAQLRRMQVTTPIIALSADEISPEDEEFRASGMNDALQKPLQPEQLQKILHRYLRMTLDVQSTTEQGVVFSYSELLSVLRNEQSVLQILNQFLSTHTGDCAALVEHIHAGRFLEARKILHNISGISGNLFCHQLYHAAKLLHDDLREERSDSLERFTEAWDTTLDALRTCYDARVSPDDQSPRHTAEWQPLWQRFYALCSDFDVTANDVFAAYAPVFADHMDSEALASLRDAVSRYDYLYITEHFNA